MTPADIAAYCAMIATQRRKQRDEARRRLIVAGTIAAAAAIVNLYALIAGLIH